jgi:uncharacterized protein YeaO (DUF488 family)
MHEIKLKRAYDKPLKSDGFRILVDRLWPRGLSKEDAAIDEWAKELAPTDRLRNWFDHDPDYWDQFQRKYKTELKQNPALEVFLEKHGHRKKISLIYSTKYDYLTHAIILKEVLEHVHAAARKKDHSF